jgi:serine/threonine protein phosphatase 1
MHKVIHRNKVGRDFVVGDLHGRYDLLKKAMATHDFDKTKDRLFSVGDIINRGPQSVKCLKLLKKPWFYMVLGNHEVLFIEAVKNGQMKDYARQIDDWVDKVPRKDLKKWSRLLETYPVSMTLKSKSYQVGLCHAEPDGNHWRKTRAKKKSRVIMLWGRRVLRKSIKAKVKGVDFTVHGHTPLHKAKWVGNRYFVDTGAWYSDKLTFKSFDSVFKDYQKRSKA